MAATDRPQSSSENARDSESPESPRRAAPWGWRLPLGWRIQLSSSALLVGLIAATLAYVSAQANVFVSERLAADLRQGRDLVGALERDRLSNLRLTAELVASFPSLKALLGTDAATVRDFLVDYRERNERIDLLIALDPDRRVIARTDALAAAPLPEASSRWLDRLANGLAAEGDLATGSGVYHAAAVPAEAGGVVFGFILAGARIDSGLARALRDLVHQEVVILGPGGVLGSTLDPSTLPWRSGGPDEDARAFVDDTPGNVEIGGESYASLATKPADASAPRLVLLQSRDRALAPYRRIQIGLLLLGLLAGGAGVAGSVLVARRVTAPIAALVQGTREVARGNLTYHLDIDRGDEIGVLARSFNDMVQGLRERKDMQRFISHSTVEMIKTHTRAGRTSSGERRTVTVFFSDIRGFTAGAEQRSPEDTVRMLNRCLSLQAGCVNRFGGDVDKFVGDSVVALFSGDDMALNAIRCALEIQRALEAFNRSAAAEEAVEVGIGLVTGDVILGSIGSDDRLDYTMIGSTVNHCARLCSIAGPRETLLAASTYQLVKGLVAAEHLEPVRIKGFSEPVSIYRMVAQE